jgi:hypothetical protein
MLTSEDCETNCTKLQGGTIQLTCKETESTPSYLLCSILIVHKKSIVEFEAVTFCILHQPQQSLITLGVDWSRFKCQLAK